MNLARIRERAKEINVSPVRSVFRTLVYLPYAIFVIGPVAFLAYFCRDRAIKAAEARKEEAIDRDKIDAIPDSHENGMM